jgi:hypothetical protein
MICTFPLVATNGKRRPPRPRIELVTPAPSPQEAAAVTAAIELFLAETAPTPASRVERISRWQWAGLQEGVRRGELLASPPPSG